MKKIFYLLLSIIILSNFISCDKNEDIPTEETKIVPTNPISPEDATKSPQDGININIPYVNGVPLVNYFMVRKKNARFIDKNSDVIEYYYKERDGVFQWEWTKDILKTDIINKGDTIIIEYVPEDAERDKVTKLKDLQQKESVFDGKTLDVELEHIYSKVTFDIKFNDNYNLNLDKYKITLLNKYTIPYGETHSAILEPQTIPVGSLIKVETEFEGEVFTKTLTEPLVLKANTELILSFEMSPITRSFSISSESRWIESRINFGQYVEIENFKAELPSNGEFAVTFQDLKTSFYYRYDKDLKSLIPQTPYLYWGNFESYKKYKIYGSFAPDTEGNPEKDILITETLDISWNNALNFDMSIHKNCLIKFELINAEGYTSAQFEEYKKDATIELEGLYEPSGYKSKADEDIFVKPKKLSDNDKFILHFNNRRYEITIKDIENKDNKITELFRNRSYNIKLNISQSAIMNVNLELTDWNEVNVNGELKIAN